LYTAVSADGIHWTPSQEPVVKAGDRSGFFFNPIRKAYTFLSRPGTPAPVTNVHRWIGIWESPDFQSFGKMHPALYDPRLMKPSTLGIEYLLPIFTVGLFILQQQMFMPPATDEQTKMQQQMMTYMTVFMGVMFYKVPAGLCIYFITSSLWGICERKLLPKSKPKLAAIANRKATMNDLPVPDKFPKTRTH
jgi:membrane protein insertase Oxa1/YidC/SpoIIIJ